MKIRFTKAYMVDGVDGRAFAEGDVIGMPDESAQHYIECGAAEIVGGAAKAPREKRSTVKATGS